MTEDFCKGLPLEIRNQIYEELLLSEEAITVSFPAGICSLWPLLKSLSFRLERGPEYRGID